MIELPKFHLSQAGLPACGQLTEKGRVVRRVTDDIQKVGCAKCLQIAGVKQIKRRTKEQIREAEIARWQKYVDEAAAQGRVYKKGVEQLRALGVLDEKGAKNV
jgi:hypothetical protein